MLPTPLKEIAKSLVTLMLLTLSLFVLSYTFSALLVKNSSLVRIAQHIVGIGNILKLAFSSFWIIWVFIRVVLNS